MRKPVARAIGLKGEVSGRVRVPSSVTQIVGIFCRYRYGSTILYAETVVRLKSDGRFPNDYKCAPETRPR